MIASQRPYVERHLPLRYHANRFPLIGSGMDTTSDPPFDFLGSLTRVLIQTCAGINRRKLEPRWHQQSPNPTCNPFLGNNTAKENTTTPGRAPKERRRRPGGKVRKPLLGLQKRHASSRQTTKLTNPILKFQKTLWFKGKQAGGQ